MSKSHRAAEAGNWSRFYVPEIHDVHPGAAAALDIMLEALPDAARPLAALLVVPNWQNRFPLRCDAFADRLRHHPGDIVLHGYTHSLGARPIDWLFSGHDDRSEFERLSQAEAAQRLALGRTLLAEALGRVPRWFCAPRWRQNPEVVKALRAAGFHGYMGGLTLRPLGEAPVMLSALSFDVGERRLKIVIERSLRAIAIRRRLAQGKPFRLTLHPADVTNPAVWRQVRDLVRRLADEGWAPLSVEQAVERSRAVAPGRPIPA